MSNIKSFSEKPFLVIDVESIGLFGEPFAVAGAVFVDKEIKENFIFSCPSDEAFGTLSDREWINKNVIISNKNINCDTVKSMVSLFYSMYIQLTNKYSNLVLLAECLYPVEANFMNLVVKLSSDKLNFSPYPFYDIASFMQAAGMDPMEEYPRLEDELPKHNPLADVKQSARLLYEALERL